MKTLAGLIFSFLLICGALPLRGQSGGTLIIGPTSSGDLTESGGTITISNGVTDLSGAIVNLNNAASLVSNAGMLVLENPSNGTVTNFLANDAGSATLSFAGTSTDVLSSTVFQNLSTGANSVIVTGGALVSAPNLAVVATTNTLSLGGTVVLSGALNFGAQQLVFPYQGTLIYNPTVGLVTPVITAASLQTNVTAGLNFNLIPAVTDFGGVGTTVQLLGVARPASIGTC